MALLAQLKIFQTIGRFRRAADVPPAAIEHVARRMGVESGSTLIFPDQTLYRHRPAVLKRLEVVSWGTEARALAQATMRNTAQARTDPADIINPAIDALIRHGFELLALATLRRLAGTANSNVNAAQWNEVCGRLSSEQRTVLEALLVVDPQTQKSPFANLCTAPGRASRKNLNALAHGIAPETAIDLEGQMMAHMPERAVLEAISNTEHWAQWGRHGLDCRLRLLQQNPNTYLRGRMSAR